MNESGIKDQRSKLTCDKILLASGLPRRVPRFIGALLWGFWLLASQVHAASSCDPQTELCHPFATPGKATSLTLIIGTALKTIIGMLGVLAFVVIVVAAVRWMAAQGNPETVQKSRDTIIWAALGLVLAATSYAILEFAFGTLRGAFYNP